jgi:hypothetical protein
MVRRSPRRFPNLLCGPAWFRPMSWRRCGGSERKPIEARGEDVVQPLQKAGYTSAVVTVDTNSADLLQSGGVHIRPHMGTIAPPWRYELGAQCRDGVADLATLHDFAYSRTSPDLGMATALVSRPERSGSPAAGVQLLHRTLSTHSSRCQTRMT